MEVLDLWGSVGISEKKTFEQLLEGNVEWPR